MTFRDHVDEDWDTVFLDTTEFAEAVTLHPVDGAADGSDAFTLNVVPEEQVGIINDQQNRLYRWQVSDHDPRRGDRFEDSNGEFWTIVNIRRDGLGGVEVRAIAPYADN